VKNIVITGSTQGIGRALANEFAKRGFNLVVNSFDDQQVKDAATALEALNPAITVVPVVGDVRNFEDVQSIWDRGAGELGSIDMWINNAGLAIMTKDVIDIDPDEIVRMVNTNMIGTMYGAKVAATGMLAQPAGGRIVNILGGGSEGKIQKFQTVYSSTKRGNGLFTEAMAKELKDTNVMVQSVRPGILITDGFQREIGVIGPEGFKEWRKTLNIIGDPVDEVAPWLVEKILAMNKNGQHVQWLTNGKIARRFATAGFHRDRDLFSRFGL
jgi:NAD(P)-dependent dehydrogenase (short-subunit alcohol dehydrogenase family)